MSYLKIRALTAVCLVTFTLSLSPTVSHSEDISDFDPSAVSDPIEGVNRAVYGFNNFLDKILIKPIAKGYQLIVPELARRGVHNVIINLSEPVTFVNSAFQGDVQNTFSTFWRFTLNSTFGIAGVFDVAKDAGLERRKEDFGQTEGVYGSGQGAYLILPILGPSNVRDAFGKVVDSFIDPFDYVFTTDEIIVRGLVGGLDTRESTLSLVDHINKTSLDPYATIRSLYTQKRWDEINNGKKQQIN